MIYQIYCLVILFTSLLTVPSLIALLYRKGLLWSRDGEDLICFLIVCTLVALAVLPVLLKMPWALS